MSKPQWFAVRQPVPPHLSSRFVAASFLTPLLLWAFISYVPFVWHPFVEITKPGSVDYFMSGMRVEKETFESENAKARAAGKALATGSPKNPIYSASTARGRACADHRVPHPAAPAERTLAASELVAEHPSHLLGVRTVVAVRCAARHRVRHVQCGIALD